MKCRHCDQEIALAKVCPYCGRRAEPPSRDDDTQARAQQAETEASGTFRGRIDDDPDAQRGTASHHKRGMLKAFGAFMSDPRTPGWKKALIIGGGAFMLVPDLVLPFIGWLDDPIVGFILIRWLWSEIRPYRDN